MLDGQSGQIRYAVLASGGTLGVGKRHTSISWQALSWDAKSSRFTLAMTAEAIQKLPEFDPKHLRHAERSSAEASGNKGAGSARAGTAGGGTGHGAVEGTERAARAMAASVLLASTIDGCPVRAGSEEVGSGDTLFIEPESGCAAFVTVASGGVVGIGETRYVVPWAALRLVEPLGEQKMQIQLDKKKADLEAAPKLGDAGADVDKAAFRDKVYAFYGVARPAFEPRKPPRDKGEDRGRRGHDPRHQR